MYGGALAEFSDGDWDFAGHSWLERLDQGYCLAHHGGYCRVVITPSVDLVVKSTSCNPRCLTNNKCNQSNLICLSVSVDKA